MNTQTEGGGNSSPKKHLWALSVSRIPLAFLFIIFFDKTNQSTVLAGLVVLIIFEITDILDGYIARRLGIESDQGALIDSLSDSVGRVIVYASLSGQGLILPFVPIAMALRDIVVSYCRTAAMLNGRYIQALLLGKIKGVVQGGVSIGVLALYLNSMHTTGLIDFLSYFVIVVTVLSVYPYISQLHGQTRP